MNNESTEVYAYIIMGIAILSIMASFIFYFVLKYQRKQRFNLVEKETILQEYEKQLLQTQLEIREQTLKTISQEIHDNIGQKLSLVKLYLGLADMGNPQQQKVSDSLHLVSETIQELRDISHSLDTDYVSTLGLGRSLEYELERIGKTGIIKTRMRIHGETWRVDKQKELIIFRIVQECLNNVIRHANATIIKVVLSYFPDHLDLSITDNGVGFDDVLLKQDDNTRKGSGMKNMEGRAALIGADFKINSNVNKGGTIVMIHLPK